MSVLSVMLPWPAAIDAGRSTAAAGLANLLTPNPREAAVFPAGAAAVQLDLGVERLVDTIFLGHTNAAEGDGVTFGTVPGGAALRAGGFAHSYRRAPVLRHAVAVLDAPVTTRFVRIAAATAQPLVAGVVAAGLSLRPGRMRDGLSGHEWGAGRPITDTGRSERLVAGFGTQLGTVAGGWQWTMPALTAEEGDRLYALALDAGTTRDLLVIEDPDPGPALNERLHWGRLTRLEPFARQAPDEVRWSMQVQDW